MSEPVALAERFFRSLGIHAETPTWKRIELMVFGFGYLVLLYMYQHLDTAVPELLHNERALYTLAAAAAVSNLGRGLGWFALRMQRCEQESSALRSELATAQRDLAVAQTENRLLVAAPTEAQWAALGLPHGND